MRQDIRSERGAILIHVAIAIVVLIAFHTFVVDYGVMWVGRSQAQNAADAGALAGAVAMAFDDNGWTDRSDTGPAKLAARRLALNNLIWGESGDVDITTDVYFTDEPTDKCPDDGTGATTPCIRVDVYRNRARGNALPIVFGQMVGLVDQGVRATATARAAFGNASDCMKPFAIADRWDDFHDPGDQEDPPLWTSDDTYETTDGGDPDDPPLPNPDVYVPPSSDSRGTGFSADPVDEGGNLGMEMTLKTGNPTDAISPGWFQAVRLPNPDCPMDEGNGGMCYEMNIASCNGTPVSIGDTVTSENGNMIGPTAHGMEDLIALDPDADWDPDTNSVVGSCAQATTPCAAHSPRIVAIPVFNTAEYWAQDRTSGQVNVTIVNILGFFIDRMDGNDVVGYLTTAPGLTTGSSSVAPEAAFLYNIQLVR